MPFTLAGVLLLALAGCSVPVTGSGQAGSSGGAGAASGAGSPPSGTKNTAPGACGAIDLGAVSAAAGADYTKVDVTDPDYFTGALCSLEGSAGSLTVQLDPGPSNKEVSFYVDGAEAKPIDGVGDSAYYAQPSDTNNHQNILVAVYGSKVVVVDASATHPTLSLDALKKIEAVLPH